MALRAAEIEALFTANVDQIGQAEKTIKQTGQRVEKNPLKVDADTSGALVGMTRVESAAKRLVTADTIVKLDAEISRAEANLGRVKARVEELQVKAAAGIDVGADMKRADAALQKTERGLKALVEARTTIDIDADAKDALAALAKVSAEKRAVSGDVVAKVDADIVAAQRNVTRIRAELEVLASQEATPSVLVDISKATARLDTAEKKLASLNGARATMAVDADTSGADQALDASASSAGDSGAEAGANFGNKIIAALVTIPVAGAVIGIGKAAADALVDSFNNGLQQEVSRDRLQALTGIDEADALRLGRAAGEAYANNFGESIESNMDTTRLALQFRILDPSATTRDAQMVTQSLAGISDVLGEEVLPTARAVATMMSSGLAKNSQEAFDILAAGARNGVNIGEDLLDTFNEYSGVFSSLGVSGEEALGLLSQGLIAGARNSDVVADGLLELRNLTTDLSDDTRAAFDVMGLSADETAAKIAAGGPVAREGLGQILDGLRSIEDPLERNTAGIAIFGTKWEDTAGALGQLDLSSAVDQLGGVTGAAQRMFDTLADNDASKLESAKRNIEVALEGIQGALAVAFSDPLSDLADWVSQNRGPLMQFMLDLANGGLDFGESIVEAVAVGTEAFGDFVVGMSKVVYGLASIPAALGNQDASDAMVDMANGMLEFGDTADATADGIRENLGGAIDTARDKLNEFGDPLVALGYVNDAALRTADSISQVGLAADGNRLSMEDLDVANLAASDSGRALQEQLDASAASLAAEYDAAILAGESQENLRGRYDTTSAALMGQLTAMGLTQVQAQSLIDTVLKTPESAHTRYDSNAQAQAEVVDQLTQKVVQMPDGSFVIVTDTTNAQYSIDAFIRNNASKRINIAVGTGGQGGLARANGGPIVGPGGPKDDLVPVWGSNGEHMLTAAEVDAAGGHGAVYRLRRALMAGSLRLANGGPVQVPDSTWRVPSPKLSVALPAPAASAGSVGSAESVLSMLAGLRLTLVVDGQEFSGYVDARAGLVVDGRGKSMARDIRSRRRSDA